MRIFYRIPCWKKETVFLVLLFFVTTALIAEPFLSQGKESLTTPSFWTQENSSPQKSIVGDGLWGSEELFPASEIKAETTARLAAWDPEEGRGFLAVRYFFPDSYHQNDHQELFTLAMQPKTGIRLGRVLKGEAVFEDGLAQYYGEQTLALEIQGIGLRGLQDLDVIARFQICDEEGTCLLPDHAEHRITFDPTLRLSLGENDPVADLLRWEKENKQAKSSDSLSLVKSGFFTRNSLLLFLLMAFIGGLLLNVMPCVLPLLSVKALTLVNQAGEDRRSILRHAGLYLAGIEISFLILALIVIILQASGRLLGWGFQFQSPFFVLMLFAVIWVFSLSLFGVFHIEAPQKSLNKASSSSSRGGYLGSFLTGIFAVLVATPCTAPLLGSALGFAFSQTPAIILGIFLSTGFGLGLPFLLLGIWPNIIKKFPKPGAWMNKFKALMGFLLSGTALYLFTTFITLVPGAISETLWWIFFLSLAAWIFGQARQELTRVWFRVGAQVLALLIAISSGFLLLDFTVPISRSGPSLDSNASTEVFDEMRIKSQIDEGEIIFLEFTADWCTTCKLNQRVLKSKAVKDIMENKNIIHTIGDITAYDETIIQWLADFNRAGVPLYVLFVPDQEPYIFPEILSVRRVVREFVKIP